MHVKYPELYFTTASILGWKTLLFDDVIKDIINYIHRNPVAKRWILAPAPELYRYSSACNATHPGYWDFLSDFWG